jgi:hypothetical protein
MQGLTPSASSAPSRPEFAPPKGGQTYPQRPNLGYSSSNTLAPRPAMGRPNIIHGLRAPFGEYPTAFKADNLTWSMEMVYFTVHPAPCSRSINSSSRTSGTRFACRRLHPLFDRICRTPTALSLCPRSSRRSLTLSILPKEPYRAMLCEVVCWGCGSPRRPSFPPIRRVAFTSRCCSRTSVAAATPAACTRL